MARKKRIKNWAQEKEKKEKKERTNPINWEINPETRRAILVVFLIALIFLSILSFFALAGALGVFIQDSLVMLFGWGQYLFPLFLAVIVFFLLGKTKYDIRVGSWLGLLLFVLSLLAIFHLFVPLEKATEVVPFGRGGGYLGVFLSLPLQKITGRWASLVVLIAILVISLLLLLNTTLGQLLSHGRKVGRPISLLAHLFGRRDGGIKNKDEDENEDKQETKSLSVSFAEDKKSGFSQRAVGSGREQPQLIAMEVTKKSRFTRIDLPLMLLNGKPSKPTSGDIKGNQQIIQKTLENFGISVEMSEVSVGPTVTQYTLRPAEGVKLAQITTLQNDLSLALAAHPIRIEAPIPGKSLVGIEVPNKQVALVNLKEILQSENFKNKPSKLTVALGKDVAGQCWAADLDAMPHLLIAGATGSGKTVCINAIIVSLLFQCSPADLRFIMVDPKRVELPLYNGIPHLLTPVITEIPKTINALKWTIREMERRFDLLSKMSKRNIQTFNREVAEKLPYIVFIIDELADLMAAAGNEVEGLIVRLAQMARAVGIHLILATQRPSVEVITGLIKANITSRIAFSVASLVDSRTILDMSGAEKLLGRGDMLYMSAELSRPKRLQGAFVADEEIKKVVDFLKEQEVADYNEEVVEKPPISGSGNAWDYSGDDSDELLNEAKEVILQAGKASASLLQRRLKVGYARAARLLDLLEEEGLIGPADGAKPREIYAEQFEVMNKNNENEDENRDEYKNEDENEDEDENENEDEDEEVSSMNLVNGKR